MNNNCGKQILITFLLFKFTVTRLREHWDETQQGALQRKSALSSMLGDSQRYVHILTLIYRRAHNVFTIKNTQNTLRICEFSVFIVIPTNTAS